MLTLTLYSKAGCHLCDVAHAVVDDVRRALAPRLLLRLDVVDVTADPVLFERFRHDVPVLAIGGEPVFRHRIDPAALRARLLAAEDA